MAKSMILMVCGAVLLFALSACSGPKTTVEKSSGEHGKVAVFNNVAEPSFLDPALMQDLESSRILINMFEGLTAYHPKTLDPVPGVAKTWKVSPDGKTYTFNLRKNAKWSNGDSVTAHDFVYSWQRVLKPETASIYAFQLYYIKNAHEINKGTQKDASQLGVKALDDYTLQVELNNPTPFFLSIVTFDTLRPVHRATVEKFGAKWTRPENIVSNGAFVMTEWIPQKHVVLEPNPHYWDRKKVYLDKAIYLPGEDQETALKRFTKGELLYVPQVPHTKIQSLKGNPEFVEGAFLATYYISMNINKKPLDNINVRRALAYAVDREQMVKLVNKGISTTALTPAGTAGYQPPQGLEFSPSKAKEHLKLAGFPGGEGFPDLTIIYDNNDNQKLIMEALQSMWKQHLGIKISLQSMEWKVLLKTRKTKDYQIARNRWIGDYMDPNTFLDLYQTASAFNHTNWGNQRYDELIKLAETTTNNKKRFGYFAEAEKILLEAAPIIPVFTFTQPAMVSRRLEGFYQNLQDNHPLKGVKLLD